MKSMTLMNSCTSKSFDCKIKKKHSAGNNIKLSTVTKVHILPVCLGLTAINVPGLVSLARWVVE